MDPEEVAAVIANEEKEKAKAEAEPVANEVAPVAAVEGESASAPAAAEENKTTSEEAAATLKAEEKSPQKSPKRSSSPFQAVKGFFRAPSHKIAKSEVG